MKRQSILTGVMTEESREWQAGFRNGARAAKMAIAEGLTGDDARNRSHYLIDLPAFVANADDVYDVDAAGDPRTVYGMGFDCGVASVVGDEAVEAVESNRPLTERELRAMFAACDEVRSRKEGMIR